MTVSAEKDRNVIQALAHVARLGEYALATVTTSDDLAKRTLTIKFVGVSAGFLQETLPYEETAPLVAHVNGKGEVEKIDGLQPGDLAETESQANAEIEAAAEQTPDPDTTSLGDPDFNEQPTRDPDQPLVGELAAAAKRRR